MRSRQQRLLMLFAIGFGSACREPAGAESTAGVPLVASPPRSQLAAPSSDATATSSAAAEACDFERDGAEIADPAAPWSISREPTELLDSGHEPRRLLRYAATAGEERTFRFSIRMRSALRRGSSGNGWIALPELTSEPSVRVIGVTSTSARVRVTQGSVDVGATPDQDPTALFAGKPLSKGDVAKMGLGARDAFAEAGSNPLELDIAAIGRLESTALLAAGKGPSLIARAALVQLPVEPVGPGARWRVRGGLIGSPAVTFEAVYSFVGDRNGGPVVRAVISAKLDKTHPHRMKDSKGLHDFADFAAADKFEAVIDPSFPFATYEETFSSDIVTSECKQGRLENTTMSNESDVSLRAN